MLLGNGTTRFRDRILGIADESRLHNGLNAVHTDCDVWYMCAVLVRYEHYKLYDTFIINRNWGTCENVTCNS